MSVAAEDPVCSKTLCDLTHHVGGKHSEGVVEQEPLAYNCAKESCVKKSALGTCQSESTHVLL